MSTIYSYNRLIHSEIYDPHHRIKNYGHAALS